MKKTICTLLALVMMLTCLSACGPKDPDPVNTKTCTYDEMVEYLTAKGYIAKGTTPVDINTTEGYVKDNTNGGFPFATLADKAEDFGGLWLFWWDVDGESQLSQDVYPFLSMNNNTLLVGGGAALLEAKGANGYFAIAFAEDYAKADEALADFNALPHD